MSGISTDRFCGCKSKRKSTGIILTANGSHKSCKICKGSKRLREIKSSSIIQAYLEKRILIRPKTRCCNHHLDENGVINKEDLNLIPTKMLEYSSDLINLVIFYLKKFILSH